MFSISYIRRCGVLAGLFVAGTIVASAQITLNTVTSPADAPAQLTAVHLVGSGFPSGPIDVSSLSVTITPPPGNGSAVSTAPIGFFNIVGNTYDVEFVIPSSLSANQAIPNCQVTVSGQTQSAVAFSSNNYSSLQIDPSASILSAAPGAGTRGTTVAVNLVGYYTHFTTSTPILTMTGPGAVTVLNPVAGSVNVTDATHLSAQFAIPANATSGTYLVQAMVGTEVASLANGFLVSVNPALSLTSLIPNNGPAGGCQNLAVVGSGTSWQDGLSVATFGDGIKVNGAGTGLMTVTDATHASIPICIDPLAVLGSRSLTIATGGEYEVGAGAFTITTDGASLQSAAPTSGPQGTNSTLTLTGVGTHWLQGATNVSISGINVGNIVVVSPTLLTVNISIPAAAAITSYSVTVSTNGEVVMLQNAFNVTLATPYLSNVSPSSGNPGQTLNVTFTGVLTSFLTGSFTANFGSDITVNGPIVPASATSATANITISNTAFTGGRSCSITTNGTIYTFAFTVNGASAFITSVTPSSGLQGASVSLTVTGSGTHWAPGLTFASLGGQIVVNEVSVNSPTNAQVDITIPSSASIGTYPLTMSTNGEIETDPSAFTVLPYTPSLTIAPSSGMIGTTVNVNMTGNFTHFANSASAAPTVANIDGEGVTILNFNVTSPHSATAQFVIDATAPTAPAVPCANIYGGNRIVTLTTPLGASAEIVNAGFCVTSTPATLISISPYQSAEPAVNLSVAITGQYTHFVQGVTTVGFGPEIVVVAGSVNVIDATHLTATIDIPANTPIGWLPVFVNTGTEQLTIGFAIIPPASASLVSVVPSSGIQGQSLTVNITGNLTNFNQATTQAILGSGITVNNLVVNSTASATAQISISPTTYSGGRTVSMISGVNESEVVSGPLFSVTQGVATISQVGCSQTTNADALTNLAANPCNVSNNGIPQGAIVIFAVKGASTHWLQGETTLDFGSGITVASLTVTSPTTAVCQITVSYSAALGFRQVTATTNGETAPSFTDAVNIVASSGLNLNITPLSAAQGTTFTMQVNGTATHFTAGNTVVSFGNNNGINITAVNVISPTQMNLTVQVLGTTYAPGPYTLTVTTTGLPVPPNVQSTEQLILPNVFSVSPGAGIITKVTPTGGAQGTTAALQVTGQNTSFQTGVTTAFLSTGGCNPPFSAGINVSNVTASSPTSATVSVAISPTAPTGFQTLCMYTLGESVGYGNAFTVTPGTPTLNAVTTPSNGSTGQQGQIIMTVALTGQYTHWQQGVTTATFGQGITLLDPITVTSLTTATADIAIDPLAYIGGRTVTVTNGSEIVSGNFFNVIAGPAILSTINPSSANQGQHILMTINGQFTHWSQTLTQFSITGAGYDITVNGVVVNSPTQALADLTLSGTASLGTRTIFMSTEGENVALNAGFLVTGGIPSVTSVSPGSGTVGDIGDNIIISGAFTQWTSGTLVDFGDPAINVTALSNNSSTSETAVITIGAGATIGVHTVTVRTGGQALLGQFNVLSKAVPPKPYISYESPGVALVGQTLQVNLYGAYTTWDPATTTATFGAGITVNTFQVLGLTSATANITIVDGATVGYRTVTLTTGAEVESTSFYVTVGTPVISLVDPGSAIQGDTRDIDLVGQYTTWNNTTQFAFCPGIIINATTIFGPNAARVNVTVPILQQLGGCGVMATTGTQVAYNNSPFSITPSTATIISVSPNTAIQGTQNFAISVVGIATHWVAGTNFTFNNGNVGVATIAVVDNTHANLTLDLAPLATPGFYNLTATTGGEVATLNNAFVVQPGTPILLSSTPGSFQQQGQFSIGILGQYTAFVNGTTTVTISGTGANITSVNVTGPQSITVLGTVNALAYTGCSNLIVKTNAQVLTLYSAFCITPGPAAITLLNPPSGLTTTTQNVAITGTNTNFLQGTTVGTFGPGISLNTLTINSPTSATANITIAASATPEANTVTLTTAGESASDPSSFTILQATPILDIVSPGTGAQGATVSSVTIDSSFTNFVNGNTTADFGAGITVNSTNVTTASAATASVTVSPIAATGTRTVRMITNLAGGAQEIAIKANSFTVTAGTASISSIVPLTPAAVHQNDSGDILTVTGNGTHFTLAALTNGSVAFCGGVNTVAVQVVDDTHLKATVNVGTFASVGACAVTVTTGGEVATGGSFNILGGIPVITQISPNAAQQGQTLTVNITGLYTNFQSGALAVNIPGATLQGTLTINSNTSASGSFTFSNTATLGVENVQVTDTTDSTLTDTGAFTVNVGSPTLVSVNPTSQGQGVTQVVTLTGAFTHFSTSSVVTVSGSGVTAGAIVTATVTSTSIQVPITVPAATPAGTRSITVQTPLGGGGTETVTLNNGYTIQPGVPNITQITPNIGVPNSSLTVAITGIFTNWVQGTTTARFGQGISVNGAAAGQPGTINVTSPTTATASLVLASNALIQAQDVTVTTGAQALIASNGFQILNSTTTPPVVTYVSPNNGITGVPINTQITLTFSEPLNPATVTAANAFVTDSTLPGGSYWSVSGLPATVSLDVSGRILTIVPTSNLQVGHLFYIQLNSYSVPGATPTIADQSGNALGHYVYSFTSGFTASSAGPTFISANIPPAATGVPTNTQNITLGFDQPIDPATQAAGLSIVTGAVAVPGTWSYNTTFTQAIFTPASALSALTTYTVTYGAQLENLAGLALTNPNNFSFTTSSGVDAINGAYVTWTPPYTGSSQPTTGTSPTIRFIFNKPINPLTVTPSGFYVYDTQNGVTVLNTTVAWSADFKTFTLNLPAGGLLPGTNYRWVLNSAKDWVGNGVPGGSVYFTTAASGADTTAPFVSSISPSAAVTCGGSPCAPVNSKVTIQFSELMDPTSLVPGAVTLTPTAPVGPAVTGTFSFSANSACTSPSSSSSCNFSLLTFLPSANLSPSTTYTVSIPDGNLTDLSGNFDPFTSTFTTGATATPDTTNGAITSITPTSNSTNVALNTNVVVQLNKPVDPLTVFDNTLNPYYQNSLTVYDQTASLNVPGIVVISANLQTLTFTQTLPFEPNHQICVYSSYFVSFYDLAGNAFNSGNACFTTGTGTDSTVPTILSVTPQNNATAIGTSNPVMLTFSKSINPGTLGNNVAIYNGSTLYTSNYNVSGDGTTITFSSGNLPFSTTFTVIANPAITDLAGNHLAAEFSSTFTTGPQPSTSQPTVTAFRPGSGATGVAATTPVTFFMSEAMNPASINSSSLVVSQNGIVISGTITVAASNQDVTFTPTGGAFAGGAVIGVFFTSAATDASGNALVNYQTSFTIAPSLATVAPTILSYGPCHFCTSNDSNAAFEILFSKPINPATATSANFYVSASSSGTPVLAGTTSVLDGGKLLRFKPTSQLSPNTYYYVFATTNLQDTTGLNFTTGSTSYLSYVYTGTGSNSAAPSVSATAPTNSASGIGTNAVVSVTFSENVDQNTLDPSNVTLSSPGGNIPLSIGYSPSTLVMTVTPQAPLPPNATVTLTLNGISDTDGDALNPTPYSLSFATAAAPDFTPPVFVTSNITSVVNSSNTTNVPVTTGISITFSKPLDSRSVIYGNSVYLWDQTLGQIIVPASLTATGANGILITPTANLAVQHQYRVYLTGLADLNGNVGGTSGFFFTTVFTALSGGPVVTQMVPVNGTNPPVNFSPMAQFDRPVSPNSLAGVTLTKGGNPVAATVQLSQGGTLLTVVPNALLLPGTGYVFTVTGVQDTAGNTMSGSAVRSFTTATGIELTNPVITVASPVYNSTTGTNPEILITFSEQINPITSSSFNFYNVSNSGFVNGSALSWAADFKSVKITYPGTLSPGTRYYFILNSLCNLANNCTGSPGTYFYTNFSADNSAESVSSVNPPNGVTGVPTNPAITLILAKPAALGSVTSASVTLSPAVAGGTTVSVSSDGYTLTLNRAANLSASTVYTINVPVGGFTDEDGNAVSSFSSSFTTGTSAETTCGNCTISMTNPAPGSAGVAITSAITATFGQPLNPNSLSSTSFEVFYGNNGNQQIAGVTTNPTPNTLVFTPAVALPPGQTINIYVGYYSAITDYAGNSFTYLSGGSNAVFTTASTPDNTPPQIISMSPGANATNVGPYAPVTITFNKSLNLSTITSANFAMYNGTTFVNPTINYSGDHRTVTLSTTLPYASTIEIAVNTGVQDYAGNNMATAYQASFTTQSQPTTASPYVIQSRPGSSAAVTTPVTMFMSGPMNLASVQAGINVAQNGVAISGTATLTTDLRGITWTPTSAFLPGALIEVYLTSVATDTSGNPATANKLSFTTQSAATGAPAEVSVVPGRYVSIAYTNPVVEVQFSRPLNPATVNSTTFKVSQGSGSGGAVIAGSISLLNNNTVARFTPAAPFPSNAYFYVSLTSGIQDVAADAFAGDSFYVFVASGAGLDNTPPTVTAVTPFNTSTGIGDNAPIRLVFSKAMDTATINSSSVQLLNGATPLPWTVTFSSINTPSQTVVTLLPQSPLPDSATITVSLSAGVNDLTGTPITAQSTTFTTMAGADFSAPYVAQASLNSNNNTNVPTNATFTFVFSKPLDPTSVIVNTTGNNTSGFYVLDRVNCGSACYPPITANISPDGRTVTIVPNANLGASQTSDDVYAYNARDLNGNTQTSYGAGFSTAAAANATGPTIVATNPLSTNTNPVPTNTSIEVIFSSAVSGASLGSVTLTGGANGPYTTVFDTQYTDDTVIRIVPQALLLPNTTYTVHVTGVTDLAGNAASTTTFAFTTGPNFQTGATNFASATVTTGAGTVPLPSNSLIPGVTDAPTITVTFNQPVDFATFLHSGITLRDVNNSLVQNVTLHYVLSTDQKTVTITTSGLAAATTYHMFVSYYTNLYDISGDTLQTYGFLYFTTQ